MSILTDRYSKAPFATLRILEDELDAKEKMARCVGVEVLVDGEVVGQLYTSSACVTHSANGLSVVQVNVECFETVRLPREQ
jgi:hypothetical protein